MLDILENMFYKQESQYVVIYQNDHLGTPQKMTALNGAVVWSAKYSSFGEASVDASSTITNNLRFAGQYFDAETGLHYNYHRYYDPDTGRYFTPDPIKLAGGINLFIYVLNNPINAIDPFGNYRIDKFRKARLVKCIHQLDNDLSNCNVLCDTTKKDFCKLKAKLNFRRCRANIEISMDLDQDGDVDDWDLFWYEFVRTLYNIVLPPGATVPPGYGSEGPGSTDPILQNEPKQT